MCRTGYFYLTPDFGMDYVRNCSGRGFHEHPANPPMFEVLSRVVNIAVLVSLPVLSAILLEYWHDSPILFVRSIEMGIGDTFSANFWQ